MQENHVCAVFTIFTNYNSSFIKSQILGLAVTSLGAYILYIKEKKVHDAIDFFFDPSTLMCTAGSITIVVTLFGWLGALREYTSCLRLVGIPRHNTVNTVLVIHLKNSITNKENLNSNINAYYIILNEIIFILNMCSIYDEYTQIIMLVNITYMYISFRNTIN